MLFRGFVFVSLRRYLRAFPAALASAALFTLAHGPWLEGSLPYAASLLVTGVLLALAYERSRSILPCILAHAALNAYGVWTARVTFGS